MEYNQSSRLKEESLGLLTDVVRFLRRIVAYCADAGTTLVFVWVLWRVHEYLRQEVGGGYTLRGVNVIGVVEVVALGALLFWAGETSWDLCPRPLRRGIYVTVVRFVRAWLRELRAALKPRS